MVVIDDKEVRLLNMQRHSLIRQLDRKEITEQEHDEKMAPILDKLKEKTNAFLQQKKKEEETKVEAPVVQDQVVAEVNRQMTEESEKKIGRKPVKDSKASYIAKALQMKTVKSFDDVAEKVAEWKEGIDKDKIKKFAKVIVREVKRGKQVRWQKYSWDEENFQLVDV